MKKNKDFVCDAGVFSSTVGLTYLSASALICAGLWYWHYKYKHLFKGNENGLKELVYVLKARPFSHFAFGHLFSILGASLSFSCF